MAISRLNTYTPGESARGDFVQSEFDQLISFVNNLDATKLGTAGGTVTNLTVSGSFTAQGSSIFNAGITVNNQIGTFTQGINVSSALPADPVLIVGNGIVRFEGSGVFEIKRDVALEGSLDFPLGDEITGVSNISGFSGAGVAFSGTAPPTYSGAVFAANDLVNKTFVESVLPAASNVLNINDEATFTMSDGGIGTGIFKIDAINIGGFDKLRLNAANMPSSTTALVTGDIWNNAGVLNIVL